MLYKNEKGVLYYVVNYLKKYFNNYGLFSNNKINLKEDFMFMTILLTALSATTATVSSTIAKHFTKKLLDKFGKNENCI